MHDRLLAMQHSKLNFLCLKVQKRAVMVCRSLYLHLGLCCSIWPGRCMDPCCTAESDFTPPLRLAPVCWHLKNQIALSSETRAPAWKGERAAVCRGEKKREKEREIMRLWESINNEENTPHPKRWGGWVSKLPPPSISSLVLWEQAGAAESGFSRALAQIICQTKSVSNMSTSCEHRKQPSTQSRACKELVSSYSSPPLLCLFAETQYNRNQLQPLNRWKTVGSLHWRQTESHPPGSSFWLLSLV